MIRVKIAGEEVLSNKNFSITEELLKTSSTILDNVYPKEWETTHDYVNNFYFPKDYSSCTIENVEPITPIIGTRVNGNNINLNYNNELSYDIEQLKGNTTQQTYTGKNLFKITTGYNGSTNNCTCKIDEEEVITLNGTPSARSDFNVWGTGGTQNITTEANTAYTMEIIYISGSATGNVGIYNQDGGHSWQGWDREGTITGNSNVSHTYSTQMNLSTRIIRMFQGVTYNNLKFKIQFTKTSTADYNYEPYVGGTPAPNPNYPQPVNNVTGRQEIDIVGKNLFDKDNANVLNAYMYYNSGRIVSDNTGRTVWIKIKPNTTYTVSKMATARFMIGTFSQQPNYNVTPTNYRGNNTATSISITSGANDTYLSAWIYNSSYDTSTPEQIMATLQIEEGNQVTTYEPYIGKQYEINLGKNLFDNSKIVKGRLDNGIVGYESATSDFSYTDNTISFTTTANWRGVVSDYIKIKPNTNYTYSAVENLGSSTYQIDINEYNSSKQWIKSVTLTRTNNIAKFTSDSNGEYIRIGFLNPITGEYTINNPMFEEGSTPTSYSPYKTPIELCKIGDYQDYIYKNNNKWYLHKEIGKVVLDGSENWQGGASASTQGYKYYYCTGYSQTPISFDIYCDKLNPYTQAALGSTITVSTSTIGSQTSASNNLRVIFDNNIANSLADFKTWLTNNKPEVYYILANSTDTEITDEELINQIKSIELYNGINNISTISPNANGELQIYYNYRDAGEDIELIFAGLVKNSGSISLRPTDPKYCSLQILDYKTLLSEGQTLDYVINNKTIKEAIQMVINSVTSYGFIEGNIDINAADDVIGAYSTLNKTPYDVFQYLADISQSKWFTRVIDEKTIAIDFYDSDKLPKANDIEYTEQYFKDNNIIDINFSFSGSDYRNKQTILSEKVYGNVAVNDVITCNGYEQTFTTTQTIGTINSIEVNNVEKTFATNTEKSLGILADFYYSPNSNSFESEELYDGGDKIIISYMPIVKGRRVITNDNEISRITQQINRNGTISRYEERNDIVDGDELSKVAEAYIKYKGTAEIKLNVLTENKDLFNIGQQVYFDMPSVDGLATDYMVKKKDIEIIQTGDYKNVFYTYELTSNFNSETDINFFDNQRRKAEGNISEDQFITRNVDINNTANIIFDNLQVEQVQTTDNNTLNCTLNSPFIN